MNPEILKDKFRRCAFHAVIFDKNKYKNHMDAILNNDYQFFYPETNCSDISDLSQFHHTIDTTVKTINKLNNSQFEASISFFYFDLLEYYYYEYIDHSECSHNEINESDSINLFIEFILSKTNSPLVVGDKKITKNEFVDSDNNSNETFELIYQDLLGNVTIAGHSIRDYYNALVVDGECIHEFIRRSKFEEF